MQVDLLPRLEGIEQINSDQGRKYYYNGVSLPSVSTILSALEDKTHLEKWKARIGYQQAEFQSRQARDYGTAIHDTMEKFLLEGKEPASKLMEMETRSHRSLLKHTIIKAVEYPLFSADIGAAGMVDCIGLVDGKYTIFDFKTYSNKLYPQTLAKYRLQAGYYGMLAEACYGIDVTQVVILAKKRNNPLVLKKYKLDDHLRSDVFHTSQRYYDKVIQ